MRQRRTFRATAWESLEGRQLLSTVPATPSVNNPAPAVGFPDLGYYLLHFNQIFTTKPTPGGTTTGGNGNGNGSGKGSQPQTLVRPAVVPFGFIDARITLSLADVIRLDTAVATFADSYSGGQNAAQDADAIVNFKLKLAAFDQAVAAETKINGGTENFITPLLTGVTPPTRTDATNLLDLVSTFATNDTYGANPVQDAAVLNTLESGLNFLIAPHQPGSNG